MRTNSHWLTLTFLLLAAMWTSPAAATDKIFPYKIHKETLKNGLDIVVIETPEFASVVSYNTLVLAGARNEVEEGKSGLAHLFEHILFRHRFADEDGGYDSRMDILGTHNNAWTWFDITFYHPLTFARNLTADGRKGLTGLIELEASRFTNLKITEEIFKTEAGAVLGEYRRIASNPSLRMSETMFALMFPHHPYGHTTMGYLKDVIDMPNEYQAAMEFYGTYYRPNNCALVVVGDLDARDVVAKIKPHYQDWKPQAIVPAQVERKAPEGVQRGQVAWDADVAPLMWIGYRTPAFRPGTKDAAVVQLLGELLAAPASPLYKKLRYEKQTASTFGLEEGRDGLESFDERLMILGARLFKEQLADKGDAYFQDVERDIVQGVEELRGFSGREDADELLSVLKTKYRNDFLASLSSPAEIGQKFCWYYRFTRDPDVLDQLVSSVDQLTPTDIDEFARKYLTDERRAVVTLTYEKNTDLP